MIFFQHTEQPRRNWTGRFTLVRRPINPYVGGAFEIQPQRSCLFAMSVEVDHRGRRSYDDLDEVREDTGDPGNAAGAQAAFTYDEAHGE